MQGLLRKNGTAFLLFFVLPVLLVLWLMGAFNPVRIEIAERGPYRYAYVVYSGDISKLENQQGWVRHVVETQKLKALAPFTLLLVDQRVVSKKLIQANVGVLLEPHALVSPPIKLGEIPRRRVLHIEVKAQHSLAVMKAYQKLYDYLKQQHLTLRPPTVEIYQHGVLMLEMNI